ncbi:MAG: PadR family transcriptional regulator [Thaumarchaeota archaeon]|nr:PadR family transcriptional regulator [Nitrososphaerota archaeon]
MQRWRNIGSFGENVSVKQYSECLTTDVDKNIRRQCVNSHLDLIILSLLNTKELSGYDLVVIIQKRFDVLLSPGTIYPILKSLDSHKLVQTSYTKRKKLYKLTDQGSLYLSQLLGGYRDFLSHIEYMQRDE